jgi:hypothetical protein
LRTLTYVTLDQANGGIVRNLTHEGIGVQAVGALRPQQQVRVRFELRSPRLRVETRGVVTWSTHSGQCGIRFLDMAPRTIRQVNEWIFGNLLEGIAPHSDRAGLMFAQSSSHMSAAGRAELDDGLLVSAALLHVIELAPRPENRETAEAVDEEYEGASLRAPLDWLSQPLSGRSLVWTINTLVMVAALLLFALIFLSITGEPPRWPLALTMGAAISVVALYWGFFQVFGGSSPGERLARLTGCSPEDDEDGTRFR